MLRDKQKSKDDEFACRIQWEVSYSSKWNFEFENQKLELKLHAQVQAIQLAISKMFGDILHVFKWVKYL
jgi:hypothetical protein